MNITNQLTKIHLSGKPYIILHNRAKNILKNKNNYSIELSLSDEKDFALANVIIFEWRQKINF